MVPIYKEIKREDEPRVNIKEEPVDTLIKEEPTDGTTYIKEEPIDQQLEGHDAMEPQRNSTVKSEPCDTGRKNVPFYFGKRKKVVPPLVPDKVLLPIVPDKVLLPLVPDRVLPPLVPDRVLPPLVPDKVLPEKPEVDDDDDDITEVTPPTPPSPTVIQKENHNNFVFGPYGRFDQKNSYKCFECGENFPMRNLLSHHMLSEHKHLRLLQCPECVRTFKKVNGLSNHIRAAHNILRRHRCPICLRAFRRHNTLTNHMKLHQRQLIFVEEYNRERKLLGVNCESSTDM